MSMLEEMCDQMMMGHSSNTEMQHHGEQNMMMHDSSDAAENCDMILDCDCTFENETKATAAPLAHIKTNFTPVLVYVVEQDVQLTTAKVSSFNKFLRNTYSPPPLFLANESFLI